MNHLPSKEGSNASEAFRPEHSYSYPLLLDVRAEDEIVAIHRELNTMVMVLVLEIVVGAALLI